CQQYGNWPQLTF
nr:immunoglobulin light chain junction region [Macaca mulatta]MPN98719.1 immunoglobulin light chain junction region [Macaca mulatta]